MSLSALRDVVSAAASDTAEVNAVIRELTKRGHARPYDLTEHRGEDRKIVRVYLWQDTPLGDLALMTGPSIKGQLYAVVEVPAGEEVTAGEVDLYVPAKGRRPAFAAYKRGRRNTSASRSAEQMSAATSYGPGYSPSGWMTGGSQPLRNPRGAGPDRQPRLFKVTVSPDFDQQLRTRYADHAGEVAEPPPLSSTAMVAAGRGAAGGPPRFERAPVFAWLYDAAGRRYRVAYRVLATAVNGSGPVLASNLPGSFTDTPDYPPAFQARSLGRLGERQKIDRIAREMDPARMLMPHADPTFGAPVVWEGNGEAGTRPGRFYVLGGNSRTIAFLMAPADKIREYDAAAAELWGDIWPAEPPPAGMRWLVVRQAYAPDCPTLNDALALNAACQMPFAQAQGLAGATQQSMAGRETPLGEAVSLVRGLGITGDLAAMIPAFKWSGAVARDTIPAFLDSADNRAFLDAISGRIGRERYQGFVADPDNAAKLVNSVLIGFLPRSIIERGFGSEREERALLGALPTMATVRMWTKQREIPEGFDLLPHLEDARQFADAISAMPMARARAYVEQMYAQQSLALRTSGGDEVRALGDRIGPLGVLLGLAFKRAEGQRDPTIGIDQVLVPYAAAAWEAGQKYDIGKQAGLFGGGSASPKMPADYPAQVLGAIVARAIGGPDAEPIVPRTKAGERGDVARDIVSVGSGGGGGGGGLFGGGAAAAPAGPRGSATATKILNVLLDAAEGRSTPGYDDIEAVAADLRPFGFDAEAALDLAYKASEALRDEFRSASAPPAEGVIRAEIARVVPDSGMSGAAAGGRSAAPAAPALAFAAPAARGPSPLPQAIVNDLLNRSDLARKGGYLGLARHNDAATRAAARQEVELLEVALQKARNQDAPEGLIESAQRLIEDAQDRMIDMQARLSDAEAMQAWADSLEPAFATLIRNLRADLSEAKDEAAARVVGSGYRSQALQAYERLKREKQWQNTHLTHGAATVNIKAPPIELHAATDAEMAALVADEIRRRFSAPPPPPPPPAAAPVPTGGSLADELRRQAAARKAAAGGGSAGPAAVASAPVPAVNDGDWDWTRNDAYALSGVWPAANTRDGAVARLALMARVSKPGDINGTRVGEALDDMGPTEGSPTAAMRAYINGLEMRGKISAATGDAARRQIQQEEGDTAPAPAPVPAAPDARAFPPLRRNELRLTRKGAALAHNTQNRGMGWTRPWWAAFWPDLCDVARANMILPAARLEGGGATLRLLPFRLPESPLQQDVIITMEAPNTFRPNSAPITVEGENASYVREKLVGTGLFTDVADQAWTVEEALADTGLAAEMPDEAKRAYVVMEVLSFWQTGHLVPIASRFARQVGDVALPFWARIPEIHHTSMLVHPTGRRTEAVDFASISLEYPARSTAFFEGPLLSEYRQAVQREPSGPAAARDAIYATTIFERGTVSFGEVVPDVKTAVESLMRVYFPENKAKVKVGAKQGSPVIVEFTGPTARPERRNLLPATPEQAYLALTAGKYNTPPVEDLRIPYWAVSSAQSEPKHAYRASNEEVMHLTFGHFEYPFDLFRMARNYLSPCRGVRLPALGTVFAPRKYDGSKVVHTGVEWGLSVELAPDSQYAPNGGKVLLKFFDHGHVSIEALEGGPPVVRLAYKVLRACGFDKNMRVRLTTPGVERDDQVQTTAAPTLDDLLSTTRLTVYPGADGRYVAQVMAGGGVAASSAQTGPDNFDRLLGSLAPGGSLARGGARNDYVVVNDGSAFRVMPVDDARAFLGAREAEWLARSATAPTAAPTAADKVAAMLREKMGLTRTNGARGYGYGARGYAPVYRRNGAKLGREEQAVIREILADSYGRGQSDQDGVLALLLDAAGQLPDGIDTAQLASNILDLLDGILQVFDAEKQAAPAAPAAPAGFGMDRAPVPYKIGPGWFPQDAVYGESIVDLEDNKDGTITVTWASADRNGPPTYGFEPRVAHRSPQRAYKTAAGAVKVANEWLAGDKNRIKRTGTAAVMPVPAPAAAAPMGLPPEPPPPGPRVLPAAAQAPQAAPRAPAEPPPLAAAPVEPPPLAAPARAVAPPLDADVWAEVERAINAVVRGLA
jgi:hypothetical protein